MRIYISHTLSGDAQAELYTALTNALPGNTLVLPKPGATNGWDQLRTAEAVLAEVSTSSTDQGIELGWADASGIPIVAVYKVGTTPADSIAMIAKKVASYRDLADLAPVARTVINVLR